MLDQLVAFTLVSVAVIVVPGPDLLLVLKNATRGGTRGAAFTALGVMTGNMVLAVISVAGLSALLLASPTLFAVVRIAGGIYLMYLGIQALRSYVKQRKVHAETTTPDPSPDPPATVADRPVISYRQGLICNLLNPKVAVFYVALIPQFYLPGFSDLGQQAVFAALFWGMGALWYVVLVGALSLLMKVIKSPKFSRIAEGVSGVALIGIGGYVMLNGQ